MLSIVFYCYHYYRFYCYYFRYHYCLYYCYFNCNYYSSSYCHYHCYDDYYYFTFAIAVIIVITIPIPITIALTITFVIYHCISFFYNGSFNSIILVTVAVSSTSTTTTIAISINITISMAIDHAPSSWSWGAVFSRLSAHDKFDSLDSFMLEQFHAAYVAQKPCKSAGLSDLVDKDRLSLINERLSDHGTKADAMKQWDTTALCKFTTLRVLALALAPLSRLADGLWLVKNGLISPHQVCGKFEPTNAKKVEDADGTRLVDQRWRTLKVQTFEDGILARVLTRCQCQAEKDDLAQPYDHHNTPVLLGIGHVGVGEELMWRHVSACASPTSSVFYNSGALGDDFSCGEAGQLYSSDFPRLTKLPLLCVFV